MKSVVLSCALLVVACGSDQSVAVDATVIDAITKPTLVVAAMPSTLPAGEFITVSVSALNYAIIDPRPGPAVKAGEGHYHYYLDDAAQYTAGWTPTVTFRVPPATSPGVHTVRFVLVNSAHQEITPTVEASATFTVQ